MSLLVFLNLKTRFVKPTSTALVYSGLSLHYCLQAMRVAEQKQARTRSSLIWRLIFRAKVDLPLLWIAISRNHD